MRGTLRAAPGQILSMTMIPKFAAIESLSLNAALAMVLVVAASANAICLLSYL